MNQIPSSLKVEVGKSGRITLPSKIRKSLGIQEGDVLTVQATEHGLHIQTAQDALERIRTLAAPHLETISTDDFIALRREEACREEEEYQQKDK